MEALNSIKSLFKSKGNQKFYKISGKATFQVEVKITGDSPYSNCVLSVHAFNNLENKIAIAAKYKWYRIYNLARVEVKASGNSYHVSPLDVGCNLMVDIIPMAEEGEEGNASVQFGPITLDPGMKKTLQGIIRSGGSRFVVDKMKLVSTGMNMRSSMQSRQSSYTNTANGAMGGSFTLFKNSFKMDREGSQSTFQVGLGEHYELISGPGSKCVTLSFNDGSKTRELKKMMGENNPSFEELNNAKTTFTTGNKIVLQLISRSARDLLIMSLRCFEAQITLEDGVIFEQVKRKLNEDLGDDKENSIDLITCNESLLREVTFLYENNVKLTKENERFQSIVRNLEGELSRSVNCKKFTKK